MAAAQTDMFKKTGAGTVTTLAAPGKALSATSITVGSTTNHPTDTGIVIAIRQVDSSGELVAGTYTEWSATVTSATSFAINAVPVYGSDQVYAAGSTTQVYIPLSAYAHNELIDGILTEHNQDGTHALVTPTLSTSINDTSGNELIKVSGTASAVNEITVTNAATGNAPEVSATGGDTNIDLKLTPKGTGRVVINGAGIAQTDQVSTSQTTTSTSYTDLATAGPAVTVDIGPSGMALVSISGSAKNSGTAFSLIGYAVSGASTVAASDTRGFGIVSTGESIGSRVVLVTGLTPGSNTFTSKYRVSAGTGTFQNRTIAVIPL